MCVHNIGGTMKKKYKTISLIILVIFMLWAVLTFIDYHRVCHSFEKPYFAVATITADDGGSGKYVGLGYSFEIKGNFMLDEELPGVTKADFYLFGIHFRHVIRD